MLSHHPWIDVNVDERRHRPVVEHCQGAAAVEDGRGGLYINLGTFKILIYLGQ